MPKRILVVEHDSALSRVLCDNFAFDGFEVLSVADPGGAMDLVRTFAPDLVVVDVAAPGTDASALLASLGESGSTPVLILSILGGRQAVPGPRPDAPSELLPKPFDLDELLDRVRALIAPQASAV